jgi:hypothetical protein
LIPGGVEVVKDYYVRAYRVARNYLTPQRYAIIIEMAFTINWVGFMSEPEYENVILDMHLYQCFEAGLRMMNFEQHLHFTCENHQNQWLGIQTLPVFVGEWSLCYKTEADGSYTEPYPNTQEREFMWKFMLAQLQVYSGRNSMGFFFWNFRTESSAMWDWQMGLQGRWAPNAMPALVNTTFAPTDPASIAPEKAQVIQGVDVCNPSVWNSIVPYSTPLDQPKPNPSPYLPPVADPTTSTSTPTSSGSISSTSTGMPSGTGTSTNLPHPGPVIVVSGASTTKMGLLGTFFIAVWLAIILY